MPLRSGARHPATRGTGSRRTTRRRVSTRLLGGWPVLGCLLSTGRSVVSRQVRWTRALPVTAMRRRLVRARTCGGRWRARSPVCRLATRRRPVRGRAGGSPAGRARDTASAGPSSVWVAGDRGIAPLPAGERHGVGRSALVWVAGGGGGGPLRADLRCGGAGWFALLQAVEGRGVGLLPAGWRHAGVGCYAIGLGPRVAFLTTGCGARLVGRGRRVHPRTGGLGQAVSVGGRPLGRRLRIRGGRGPRRRSSLMLGSRSGRIVAVSLDFGVERVAHPYSSSMFSSSAGSSGPTAPVHRTHSSPSGATWSKATAPSR